jgi:hypothetical protein
MPDEVIRSHLPNDNYRRGWEETFGKTDGEPHTIPSGCQCGWFLCDRCKARMAPARADGDPVARVDVANPDDMVTVREEVTSDNVFRMPGGCRIRFVGKAQEECFSHPSSEILKVESEPEVLPRRCKCGYLTCDRCRWLGGFPVEAWAIAAERIGNGDH